MSTKTKTQPKGLTFTHNGHRYKLDGLPVTGVTTILNGGVPKPALVYWAGKTVAEYVEANPLEIESLRNREDVDFVRELAGIPAKVRDDAGVTGTAVHDFAEALATKGEVEDVPEGLVGYVEGYADFLDRFQITPLLMERPCASRKDWYAGKFDMIATSPLLNDGNPVMIDLKTSKYVYGETGLQTAAYSLAEFYMDEDGKEQPLPEIAATYVAHVTPMDRIGVNARYGEAPLGTTLYPLAKNRDEMKGHYAMFLAAAYTHKTTKLRESIVGEPVTTEQKAAAA
ncbi:hypothetical protein [Paenarthrobacter ureafaciens]|uniref:hypothetical protein n=1 Tax=Paenarthrobacter ureafaciens TaxID=37931 RepID=UPI001FB2DC5D|nr:hypothetical protein [Paenarthrobacter ureafaciens]UOD80313.1 hypothetical protein MQZ73_14490 [Paenarthrobacter ureafaciens]WNZ04337.1 hypothetical protein PVT25_01900 [Paenarthrobacter ureafaciens]